MEIRFELNGASQDGFEVSCQCGVTFRVQRKTLRAQCPHCDSEEEMASLFEDWWRAEPTVGRFAYREA
ncbi:MAG: hypothetical protein ACE5Q3_05940 [Alphaproteobacteria bacterium]